MNRLPCAVLFAGLVLLAADQASAQLPWRGHYVRRQGLFHVEKLHWGGGVNPYGAQVLMHGFDVAGSTLPVILRPSGAVTTGARTVAAGGDSEPYVSEAGEAESISNIPPLHGDDLRRIEAVDQAVRDLRRLRDELRADRRPTEAAPAQAPSQAPSKEPPPPSPLDPGRGGGESENPGR